MNNMSTGDNVQEPAAASRYSPSSHSVADKVVSASDDALCEEFAAVKPKNQPGLAWPQRGTYTLSLVVNPLL